MLGNRSPLETSSARCSSRRRTLVALSAVSSFAFLSAVWGCSTRNNGADGIASGGSHAAGGTGTTVAGGSSGSGGSSAVGVAAGGTAGSGTSGPTACDSSIEAETMTASTGEAVDGGWNIYTQGTLSGSHTFKGGPTTITVVARGAVAGGVWPHMIVRVGGSPIGELDVSADAFTSYPFSITASAGEHAIEIEFTNDGMSDNGEDRNLYIDKVDISENCDGSSGSAGSGGGTGAGDAGAIDARNPFAGATLYLDPNLKAISAEQDLRNGGNTADADLMKKIASSPQADWVTGQGDPAGAVRGTLDAGGSQMRVLVAYNIYNRDCSGMSGGGAADENAYKSWIDGFASGIGDHTVAIILEPDTLASDCDHTRWDALSYAVTAIKTHANAHVYIDAGHANWVAAGDMATRLMTAGVANADGFALNVSSFQTTDASIAYGTAISGMVGNKPFVIDTSRNGKGPASGDEWCNPPGRGLGAKPTFNTGNPLVHAFLWIKRPGESDGACNGGPAAGQWFQAYALALAANASF